MNKYQRVLKRIRKDYLNNQNKDCDVLEELVKRETPKKPTKRYYTTKYGNNGRMKRVDILCPCCKSYFVNGMRKSVGLFASREKNFIDSVEHTKYCMFCGNRIDWSDEE